MKKILLTNEERAIEKALLKGEFRDVTDSEFERIAGAIARHRKDAVLNLRVNSKDLADFKKKARRLGVPYQSLLSELLHHFAT